MSRTDWHFLRSCRHSPSTARAGHHGTVEVSREYRRQVARCRFRDLDGITRRVTRGGTSKATAQAAPQDELRQRTGQQRTEVLKPNSRFREAADVRMTRPASAGRTPRGRLRDLPAQAGPPQLGELQLSECDTGPHVDAFFSRLERARKVVELPDGATAEKPALAV